MITDMDRTPCGMLKRELNDFLFHFRRCFVGKGLGDWRLIYQTLKTLFLKSPFLLVELTPGNTMSAAGFGYVS